MRPLGELSEGYKEFSGLSLQLPLNLQLLQNTKKLKESFLKIPILLCLWWVGLLKQVGSHLGLPLIPSRRLSGSTLSKDLASPPSRIFMFERGFCKGLPRAWECPGGSSSWEWESGSPIPHNREHGPCFCPSQESPLHLSQERDRGGRGAGAVGTVSLRHCFPFISVRGTQAHRTHTHKAGGPGCLVRVQSLCRGGRGVEGAGRVAAHPQGPGRRVVQCLGAECRRGRRLKR